MEYGTKLIKVDDIKAGINLADQLPGDPHAILRVKEDCLEHRFNDGDIYLLIDGEWPDIDDGISVDDNFGHNAWKVYGRPLDDLFETVGEFELKYIFVPENNLMRLDDALNKLESESNVRDLSV